MSIISMFFKDGYKVGHKFQYPEGTTSVYSNLTARSDKILQTLGIKTNGVVMYGLQYFIKDFLIKDFNENFFFLSKDNVVNEYKDFMDYYLGKNSIDVSHIGELHDLGYLPIKIKSFDEGTVVPFGVPLLTIENTQDKFFWLTNALETVLSAELWKMIVNATLAFEFRKFCDKYSQLTCDNNLHIPFQCHDFSARGLSGRFDMMASGSCHLLSFKGTDTLPSIRFLENFYNAKRNEGIGHSIPASEHSVMCAGGEESELETYKRLINVVYPEGLVSLVSDTWDYWDLITQTLIKLKGDILKRNGTLVIRPDSGCPVDVICGTAWDSDVRTTPQEKGSIEILWEIFGGTINSKGYKVLDKHIGLIYGDSITYQRMDEIFKRLKYKGFASSNVVLGIGAYTYNFSTRDTLGLAVKATYCEVGGESRMIQKSPKTDSSKKSHKGKLRVYRDANNVITYEDGLLTDEGTMLNTVFEDGKILYETSLNEIRERLNSQS